MVLVVSLDMPTAHTISDHLVDERCLKAHFQDKLLLFVENPYKQLEKDFLASHSRSGNHPVINDVLGKVQ